MSRIRSFFREYSFAPFFLLALLVPLVNDHLSRELQFADALVPIFIFAVLGLGLNIVTGYTGMLNLGAAGFMAIGAYVYAISTTEVYPFQFGFVGAACAAMAVGAFAGLILGLPTMRLVGDYLAIVTLGFGEIIQSLLRNLETITKGTQGIDALKTQSYFLYLGVLFVVVLVNYNLENSRVGRTWMALRDDELASRCMGIEASRNKLLALAVGSAFCALAGALYASSLGSSGEPGNYDFQISVTALCVVIVGGMGSIRGVLLGALVVLGFNSILLVKLSEFLMRRGVIESGSVYFSPGNWKYLIFGFALVFMMRFRPQGFFGQAEGARE